MKRKLPEEFKDDELEIDFIDKIPSMEGDEKETDAIDYRFDFSLRHIASVNLLFSKCVEFMQEDVVKTFYRNCAGEIHFADILLKHLYSVFPYFSATRVKLSCMVTQVVKTVYNWIRHIDRIVFNVRCARQSMALDFVHHIVITSRGTINYAASAENLLRDRKFDDFDRLKIVCVHCLEKYMVSVVRAVSIPEGRKVFTGTMKMMEFWKIIVNSGQFTRAVYNITDEIFNAVGTTNTEALKYLWVKTDIEERGRILIKLIRRSEADFQCYLLSQVNGDEQQMVFKNCGGVILNNLFEDFIWGSYLMTTAYHARNVIPSRQYYEFMKRITFCMQFDKQQCRNDIIFRQLWRYATKRIKDLIFRHENSHIFYWFRNDINAEYMLTLFSDASAGFKQNFILSNSCLKACMDLVKNNNMNVLETIIRKTYAEEEEKYKFKQILLNDNRCQEIICHIVNEGDKMKFDSTIGWFFTSEDEAIEYKKNFTYNPHYLDLFKIILARATFGNSAEKKIREEIDFSELDEKICWFLSCEQDINDFKENRLATSETFQNAIHELVKSEQYALVEQLLCWCLPKEEAVARFKEALYGDSRKTQIMDMVFELFWKNDDFKSLNNFVAWCYDSNDAKINQFKKTVSLSYEESQKLWGSLLIREEFQMAEQFMNWLGFKDLFAIQHYKNELMLNLNLEYVTNDVKYILEPREGENFGCTEADRVIKSHRLIRWFNPTIETYQKFRQLLFVDELKYSKYCNLIRIFMEENEIDGFVI